MDVLANPVEIEVTTDGNIPQGALFISVKNIGAQAATVNGVSLAPGEAKSYSFIGKPYQGIPYQVGGSTLRILYIL